MNSSVSCYHPRAQALPIVLAGLVGRYFASHVAPCRSSPDPSLPVPPARTHGEEMDEVETMPMRGRPTASLSETLGDTLYRESIETVEFERHTAP